METKKISQSHEQAKKVVLFVFFVLLGIYCLGEIAYNIGFSFGQAAIHP